MKICVSEDGEAGDDRVVKSCAKRLRAVDLPAGLVLELSGGDDYHGDDNDDDGDDYDNGGDGYDKDGDDYDDGYDEDDDDGDDDGDDGTRK